MAHDFESMDYYSSFPEDDDLFIPNELYELVYGNRPVELDAYLRHMYWAKLALNLVEERGEERISLLMIAALHGFDQVVHVLLAHNPTTQQVELEGCVHNARGQLVEKTTALWCALNRDRYEVAHTLIDVGKADVNHGPYHPMLIDAIIMKQFGSMYFLVENGYVNVNQTVANGAEGGTALILAACCRDTKAVIYLLSRGAKTDHKTRLLQNTALSYAAGHGCLDTVNVLCLKGASPIVKNSIGMTPLMLAAENGHLDVVDFLFKFDHDQSVFNDLELLASSHMIANDNVRQQRAEQDMQILRYSCKGRLLYNTPKTIVQPIAAYDFHRECQSMAELDQIQHDNDRLYIEALLIRERILLPQKNITLFTPLAERIVKFVESGQFNRALDLSLRIFHLYQQMELDSNLDCLIWIFCRMITAKLPIPIDQFLATCHLVFQPSQQKPIDAYIKNALHLVTIASKVLEQPSVSSADRRLIIQWVQDLCRQRHTTSVGQTLLHLSVDDETHDEIDFRPHDIGPVLEYPNMGTTRLLITYGRRWIDLDAVDQVRGDTALHVISRCWEHDGNANNTAIVDMLIHAGAHIDCVNEYGRTPLDIAAQTEIHTLLRSKQTPPQLKCLCARLITNQKLAYDCLWPAQTSLNTFVLLHGGLKKEHSIYGDYGSPFYYFDDGDDITDDD